MNTHGRFFFFLSCFLITFAPLNLRAGEESLDLDDVKPAPQAHASPANASKFALMGRVDLTSETLSTDSVADRTHTLDNNHFLIFLKIKASEKTSFMGEIASKSFFAVNYSQSPSLDIEFGKIIIPFGDTRRFHHFYGGVQGYKANGVMLPNLWSESGFNLKWKMGSHELDTYLVDSIQDGSKTSDPSLQSADEPRTLQAVGLRWSLPITDYIHGILSAYRGEYQPGNSVELLGADAYSDYGVFGLTHWRWAAGIANAWLRKAPISGDFQKRGDYLEVVTNLFGPGESRLRYGTYIDNDKNVTQKDTHSFNLGYILPVDALRILTEYQWNFESVNEKQNDLLRVMVSLDF